MELVSHPVRTLSGRVSVPGDKSISHRAALLGALADGETSIRGFLRSEDCLNTLACVGKLGARVNDDGTFIRITGRGARGFEEPNDILDLGNSGTGMRLLLGAAAPHPIFAVFSGDASLRKRPMDRVIEPLRSMGAKLWARSGGRTAPVAVQGGNLQGIHYESPVASAQVKSALLLAGLRAEGVTEVVEPAASRDHTERMLRYFGAPVEFEPGRAKVPGGAALLGRDVVVPGDISSAAFFLVAGAVVPEAEIVIENVGINPTRTGILEVLRQMGAEIEMDSIREEAGEPVADLTVRSSSLRGATIDGDLIPRLIDELPIIAVAACFAEGTTEVRDAGELRVKESDRIATIEQELANIGVKIDTFADGFRIRGPQRIQGGTCQSHMDHRIAMSMAVAGLIAQAPVRVREAEVINTSFPGFEQYLRGLNPAR